MINWIKENSIMILLLILSIIIVFCFHTFIAGYDIRNLRTAKDFWVLALAYTLCVPVAFVALVAFIATIRGSK
jgi:hypothetical protein